MDELDRTKGYSVYHPSTRDNAKRSNLEAGATFAGSADPAQLAFAKAWYARRAGIPEPAPEPVVEPKAVVDMVGQFIAMRDFVARTERKFRGKP